MNTDPASPAAPRFSQAIINTLPMSLAVLATDGSITAVNQAWIAFVNEKAPAMKLGEVGVNYLEEVGGISGLYGEFGTIAREGIEAVLRGVNKHFSMEFPIQAGAQKSWYLLHAASVGTSEAESAIVSHFEITSSSHGTINRLETAERKELEQRFIQSQKMEIVGQLTSGVAHDFNNLIAVIVGYADLIGEEAGRESPLQNYLEEIRSAINQACHLSQQLLIFNWKPSAKAGPLDLNATIAEMEEMLRRLVSENIALTFIYGEKAGHIELDPGSLWQLLINLVVNARDAMESGGKLNIETSGVELGGVYLKTHPAVASGKYVALRVTDTGIGMSEAVKSRLFEPFFTTKAVGKGTGLGLATCESIIKQSGGHIDVVTAPNMGTTFNIYFPLINPPPVDKPEPVLAPPASSVKGGTETLLLVEDDASLRKLVVRILKAHGYGVISAANGREALRIAEEYKGDPISLILTDVVMPQMGGVVMAEWLQTTHPEVKVLFTSGYSEDLIAQQGVVDGGLEFLPKPYTSEALLAKVREVLDKEYAF